MTGRAVQLHGGGYIGPMNIYRKFAVRYSRPSTLAGMLTADYRLPGISASGGLEDALMRLQWLVKENATARDR